MYQNYDEMIKELAKDYVDYLKKKGMTYKEYDLILSTDFASRVCFYNKICSVEKARKYVLDIMMRDYNDSLNSIERIFVEKYNAICEAIGHPKFVEESFFEDWNAGNLEEYLYRYEENRIARYVDNRKIAEVVKYTPEYLEEKKELLDSIKEKTADVVYRILDMASNDEKLWGKDA